MTQRATSGLAGPALERALRATIRDVPDFPKPGILFKDITPVLADPALFGAVIEAMAAPFAGEGITHVVAIESRGFLLGAPIALRLDAAIVPMRKPGKLPHDTVREEYALEYGTDALEMHVDALDRGSRVLVVDDVLATGGTARAACALADRHAGAVVGCSFLMALSFLEGAAALGERRVETLLQV